MDTFEKNNTFHVSSKGPNSNELTVKFFEVASDKMKEKIMLEYFSKMHHDYKYLVKV